MSSDRFDYIITEIPGNIDKDMIKDLRSAIKDITAEDAIIMNDLLELNTDELFEESLDEDDLFEIGEESLKVKKAMQDFLNEAVSQVLVPRMYCEKRISSPLNVGEFSYISIRGRSYVISGQQVSYYSTKLNIGYKYVLALSLSNLLGKLTEEQA